MAWSSGLRAAKPERFAGNHGSWGVRPDYEKLPTSSDFKLWAPQQHSNAIHYNPKHLNWVFRKWNSLLWNCENSPASCRSATLVSNPRSYFQLETALIKQKFLASDTNSDAIRLADPFCHLQFLPPERKTTCRGHSCLQPIFVAVAIDISKRSPYPQVQDPHPFAESGDFSLKLENSFTSWYRTCTVLKVFLGGRIRGTRGSICDAASPMPHRRWGIANRWRTSSFNLELPSRNFRPALKLGLKRIKSLWSAE